jgi:hypothetical protein
MDRSSFRALMDDLDNITIEAHHQIDKFKLVDARPPGTVQVWG